MKKCVSILAAAALLVGLCSCTASAPLPPPSGSMMPEGSKYVDYTGAILPLTIREAHDGLSVQRSLNLDFSQWTEANGIAEVQDDYILTNTTETSLNLMLYYPIASSLEEWREESCSKICECRFIIDHKFYILTFAVEDVSCCSILVAVVIFKRF